MKAKPYTLLLHPLFVASIVILLLNDFCFKYQFNNALTGKLSDFAGLFAFAVFLLTVFRGFRRTVIVACALFFCWWKSPLSSPAIAAVSGYIQLPIGRVTDYTDLLALTVLPFTLMLKPVAVGSSFARSLALNCIGIISFFSFTATSMIRRLADDDKVKLDKYVRTRKTEAAIIERLRENGLDPQKKDALYERVWTDNYVIKPKGATGDTTWIPLDSIAKGIYLRHTYGSTYTIPRFPVAGDTVRNLTFLISDFNARRNEIWLHSFEYGAPGANYYNGYEPWRKFKAPITKKIRKMLKDKR